MKRFTVTREFYISPDAVEVKDKQSSAVVYVTVKNGTIDVMAFGGRRQKYDFYRSYRSEERAQEAIKSHLETIRIRESAKKKSKSFLTTLKVGDILYSSWGYDQTNIDFYQVVEIKKSRKSIVIYEIAGETVETTGAMQGRCVAVKDTFTGKPMLKRVREGNIVSITSYASAFPWDGKPKYWSAYH